MCVLRPQAEKHHPALVKLLCSELDVKPEDLLDFELCLADTQAGVSLQVNIDFLSPAPMQRKALKQQQ